MPEIGPGVRSFPDGSHVIYYLMRENPLVVFGVLHKHTVPDNHPDQRGID